MLLFLQERSTFSFQLKDLTNLERFRQCFQQIEQECLSFS